MATINKDFKVKHGIQVAGDATIGGSLSVADPTQASHVATKSYVDTIALPNVSDTSPESPNTGALWLDTVSQRLHVFDGASWIALATLDDASELQDHIHDTSIDGSGLIVSIFVDAGSPSATYYWTTEAGAPSNTDWVDTWSGGSAVDNFN